MVVWLSVPTRVSGKATVCRLLPWSRPSAEVFQVDLVADAGARRHHAEVVEGLLAPAQEGIALAVALHSMLDVLLEAQSAAELSTITEWSITRSTGTAG